MKPELKIDQKILAYKSPQRYAVRKAVVAASEELRSQIPKKTGADRVFYAGHYLPQPHGERQAGLCRSVSSQG
jgi:hypothetical protein